VGSNLFIRIHELPDVLFVRCANLEERDELLKAEPEKFFITPPITTATRRSSSGWHRARPRRRPAYLPEPCGFRLNNSASASAASAASRSRSATSIRASDRSESPGTQPYCHDGCRSTRCRSERYAA
jgi:hypothetical protein